MLLPIDDYYATGTYYGLSFGLYRNNSNIVPTDHYVAGINIAQDMRPLDQNGVVDVENGALVWMSAGYSNIQQVTCNGFNEDSFGDECLDWTIIGRLSQMPLRHQVKLVNGAYKGKSLPYWSGKFNENYDRVHDLLSENGLSEKQVQSIWFAPVNKYPQLSLPNSEADYYNIIVQLGATLRLMKQRYSSLKQVLLSSRVYAGYGTSALNPEPYAYESGFAVSYVINAQIQQMRNGIIDPLVGDLNYLTGVAPFIDWMAYYWGDAIIPRNKDGVAWYSHDFQNDGIHPSSSGEAKMARLVVEKMKFSDYFSWMWY